MRRYLDDPATSAFSLEAEDVLEGGPTRVRDGAGEVAVLEHVLDPKVFDCDEGVSVHVLPGRFVRVILTLAGDLEVLLGGLLGRLTTAVGPLLASSALALRAPEFLPSPLEASRVFDGVAIGIRDEMDKAHVQPDRRTVPLLGRVTEVADDEDVPVAIGPEYEVGGLGGAFERTVPFDLEAASELLRNSQTSRIGVEVHVPSRSVLTKLYRVPAVGALEAREADLASALLTMKETLECLIQPVRERLYGGLRHMLAAPALEAVREIVAAEKRARLVVVSIEHFEHLVVKTAAFGQTGEEQSVLVVIEEKPVLEGLVHLLVLLDTRAPHNGYSSSRLKATTLNLSFM